MLNYYIKTGNNAWLFPVFMYIALNVSCFNIFQIVGDGFPVTQVFTFCNISKSKKRTATKAEPLCFPH